MGSPVRSRKAGAQRLPEGCPTPARAAGEEHADVDTPQKMRKLSAASSDAAAALPKKTQKNAKKSSE